MKRVLIRFLDGQSLIHSIPNVLGYLVVAYPGEHRADRRVRLTTYKGAMPVYEEQADVDAPATGYIPSRVESGQGHEVPDDWMQEERDFDDYDEVRDRRLGPPEKQAPHHPAPPPPPTRLPGIAPDVAADRRRKQAEQRIKDNQSVKRSYRLPVKED